MTDLHVKTSKRNPHTRTVLNTVAMYIIHVLRRAALENQKPRVERVLMERDGEALWEADLMQHSSVCWRDVERIE